jgi:hypothetical protein
MYKLTFINAKEVVIVHVSSVKNLKNSCLSTVGKGSLLQWLGRLINMNASLCSRVVNFF